MRGTARDTISFLTGLMEDYGRVTEELSALVFPELDSEEEMEQLLIDIDNLIDKRDKLVESMKPVMETLSKAGVSADSPEMAELIQKRNRNLENDKVFYTKMHAKKSEIQSELKKLQSDKKKLDLYNTVSTGDNPTRQSFDV